MHADDQHLQDAGIDQESYCADHAKTEKLIQESDPGDVI